MQTVYYKTGTSDPVAYFLTPDGRIDLSALGATFKLDPKNIFLNGLGVPKAEVGSESCNAWEQIEKIFKDNGEPVGTKDDTVVVSGLSTDAHRSSLKAVI